MDHTNLVALVDIEKMEINIRKGLVVRRQSLDENILCIQGLLGYQGRYYTLQKRSPFRWISSGMWSTKKNNTESRDSNIANLTIALALIIMRDFQSLCDTSLAFIANKEV
jgi:hypothetical protein